MRAPIAAAALAALLVPTSVSAAGPFRGGAVAADHPLASEAGRDILAAGGNAADAAVATALVLGVVNPFASGIGGGGFALWRGDDGAVVAYDFRETAPAAAHRDMYLDADGAVVPGLSTFGGLAVAVPGEVAGLARLHADHGQLPWADVVAPALELARDGFPAGTLLPERLAADAAMERAPALAEQFRVDGRWIAAGELLRRPALADALELIGREGPGAFYSGPVAHDIADAVVAAGGILTTDDLAAYAVEITEPLTGSYRGHRLYGMPSPSSGGFVVLTALAALEPLHLDRVAFESAATAHSIMQAFAHTFSDRARDFGDDRFVAIDWARLMGAARVAAISDALDPVRTLEVDAYGALLAPPTDGGTSHLSAIDAAGNAVALTTTINTSFGSHVVSPVFGVLLNNEMDDFAAAPGVPNAFGLVGAEANAIAPGKRPLSSMSPTLVTRVEPDGSEAIVGALGASGGPQIITSTTLGLVQLIDHGRAPEDVVAAPRVHHQWLPFLAFVDSGLPATTRAALAGYGYEVAERAFGSALQVVWLGGDGLYAASDPRKHGAPAGIE